MYAQNLAELHPYERNAVEEQKLWHFIYWQQNLPRAREEARRIYSGKECWKGKWTSWSEGELARLAPATFQSMVRRELSRLC
ncbi:hypothetical protein [Pseudomonas tohonis]|uniref:hypothetical protein n=1 Tax=Pseudomonas tohonis TaxID=2725477 RepID=UPI001F1EFA44|nr:hypothetical protein [Pseudomonas tohonis]